MGTALADRMLLPDRVPADRAADSRARVLEAALRRVAQFGMSKTTVEDIAREAHLSRATMYRFFPGGRDEIMATMVEREVRGFFWKLGARLDGVDDYEERIVVAMTAAAEQLVSHEALSFVLAHEPELLLPHVLFAELDQLLDTAAAFFAPYLVGLLEPEDARRAAEWVTRLVLSHVLCPSSSVDDSFPEPRANSFRGGVGTPFALHPEPLSEDRASWLVATFITPGIRALTAASAFAVS